MEPIRARGVATFKVQMGRVMTRAEEYRRYAAECVRVAQQTNHLENKALLLRMADKWRELASRTEESENKTE